MFPKLTLGAHTLKAGVLSLTLVGAVAASAAIFALTPATPVEAHCDSVNGPVVHAAQQALDQGNVELVLPYVQPASEAEVNAAFQHTNEVRKLGGEAQKLADQYFFETVVRLHRSGEGADYTGLKTQTDFGPALAEAEKTLETGSLEGVYGLLYQTVKDGVAEKYQAVVEARGLAAQEGTVEANRERAEAELLFEKYILGVHETAKGTTVQGEGAQPEGGVAQTTGHSH